MTKENLIKAVEVAEKIYELQRQFPVRERHTLDYLVNQLNQADWDQLKQLERAFPNTTPLGAEGVAVNATY